VFHLYFIISANLTNTFKYTIVIQRIYLSVNKVTELVLNLSHFNGSLCLSGKNVADRKCHRFAVGRNHQIQTTTVFNQYQNRKASSLRQQTTV
jgi:hypothetical protein